MVSAEFLTRVGLGAALVTTGFSAAFATPVIQQNVLLVSFDRNAEPEDANSAQHRVRELERKLIPQAQTQLYEHRKSCDLQKRALQPASKTNDYARDKPAQNKPMTPAVSSLMKRCAPKTRELEGNLDLLLAECVTKGGCSGF